MLDNVLRIATRQSPLALWQAQYVKQRLEACHQGLRVELVPMVTRGDVILDTPLAKVGGKGLFVKELEIALLENRADIAVHSMKDVPVEFPEGLGLVTICEREDPRDAFVSNHYASLDDLPEGSVVGTSSLRRQCQLAERRPDLVIRSLRGNVGTRSVSSIMAIMMPLFWRSLALSVLGWNHEFVSPCHQSFACLLSARALWELNVVSMTTAPAHCFHR